MDFFKASVPGSLGALVGQGVKGTYPKMKIIEQEQLILYLYQSMLELIVGTKPLSLNLVIAK
jgi:hypothetical protein